MCTFCYELLGHARNARQDDFALFTKRIALPQFLRGAVRSTFFRASSLLALFAVLLWAVSAPRACGQAVYGSIDGRVADSSGGGVSGATVTITDLERNVARTTTTNASGNFTQPHLIIGRYRVEVEFAGFKKEIVENIAVAVDTVHTVDVTLQPGDVKQTITVTDEAPLLKTERTDVSTTLSERQVDELPNFGRNFSNLLLLTPGTVQFCWGDTSTENPQGGIAVNVNGQMFVGVGSILDGTDNRDFLYGNMLIVPNLDAVVQMKVTSANYDAEFGQASAAVVTTSTKSGTNDFHGSVFYYNRNDSTYARDPFAESTPDPVTGRYIPVTNWNQFGGSVGGPIIRNKLFFFADYQGTRAVDGGSALVEVPTAAERAGDFSAWAAPSIGDLIYNPLPISGGGLSVSPGSRQQFVATPSGPNANPYCTPASSGYVASLGGCPNMIPTSMISPVSLNLIKLLPMPTNPNAPTGTPNYAASVSDTYHASALDGRADYFYSDNLRFFDRYTFTQFYKSAPGIFGPVIGGPTSSLGYTGSAPTRPQSNAFGFDKTIRPNLLADFRFGWYKQRINVEPYTSGDFATQAGAPGLNIPSDPSTSDFPHFGIQGPGGFDIGDGLAFNCNCPLIERMQQFQFASNWTWVKGKHTIKFGPDIKRLQNLRVPSDIHRSGDIYFSPQFTEGENGPGLGMASYLLGYASNMARYVSDSTDAGERQWRNFFYGEDSWRATSKLTLNFGVRWEIYYPQTVTGKDQGGWIDLKTGEVLVAGENGVGLNGNVQNTFKNLAPRLGIAYLINPKTVLRLGYGRTFDVGMFGSIFGHTATQNLPVLAIQTVNPPSPGNLWDPAFQLSVGPPLVTPAQVLADSPIGPGGNHMLPNDITPWVFPRKMLLPTVDAWNATVQRQITPTFSLEAGYVGNKGTHVQTGENNWLDINAASPVGYCNPANPASPTTGCLSYNERQPYFDLYGWTQPLRCVCDPGDNHYNSLQVKAEQRPWHGLNVLGVYTYSHAKNHDAPEFSYDPSILYGRPNWQRNHVLSVATIYELPFGRGKQFGSNVSGLMNQIVGGWQLANNTTWMSGLGFNVSYNECGLDTDVGTTSGSVCFPNLVGNPNVSNQNQYHWFAVSPAPLAANGQTSGPWQRPLFGTFGDSGRNTLLGPKWFDSDLSVIKNFPIREQMRMQFRAEIYNLFNHANLGNPNGCVDCGTGSGQIFGLANNASMRKMQFALRFEF
jgi:Carboxypeptidase regulatory-like domain/TonB dependent receptor